MPQASNPKRRETMKMTSEQRQKFGEIIRFCIVGGISTVMQYVIYYILIQFISSDMEQSRQQMFSTLAMTIGYIISFVFNFIASTRYTFRVEANAKKGVGFVLCHVTNYFLQMLTLNLFIWLGVSKGLAPIPMFAICVPVNFLLVRFALKR